MSIGSNPCQVDQTAAVQALLNGKTVCEANGFAVYAPHPVSPECNYKVVPTDARETTWHKTAVAAITALWDL